MPDCLIIQQDQGVLTLTLNRPAARNALDIELTEALMAALAGAKAAAEVRAIVLTGAAPAFCAGLDLKAFTAADAPRHLVTAFIQSLPLLGKPLIAAVRGAAVTGGLEVALSCDFIIAGKSAKFADTHLAIGALSGSGMGARLPNAVGARWARQMMLTCQPIDAETALRIGLINELVEDDDVVARAQALAIRMAGHDPELLAIARSVINLGSAVTLTEALEFEAQALAKRKAEGPMGWKPKS